MAAKNMWDYLSVVDADNDVILDVSPNKVINETGSKNVSIRIADDGTETRVSLSDTPIFYVTMIFSNRNASDIGTIMDYYYDSSKGNGNAESFRWLHPSPGDSHIYTVRFDGKLSRQIINAPTIIYGYSSVRLRILGAGDRALDAADNSSLTEITVPGFTVIWAIDAADNSSLTEITVPALDVVRAMDAEDNSSLTEITVPGFDVVWMVDAPDVSSNSEITAASLTKVP